jgi:site-specific recombinase XerD
MQGTRLGGRQVEKLLEKYLAKAGLSGQGLSPHKLRHTAATMMYQHGNVDIRILQEILGHSNLATTEIYTHVASSQIESAVQSSPTASLHRQKREAPKKTESEQKK